MQPSPMNDAFATCQVSSSPGAPPSNPISYHDYGNVYSTRDRYSPPYSSVPAQNLLQCPQCTSEFETENCLQQHQIAKQHLFECSLCDGSFFTHAALFQHQKISDIVKGKVGVGVGLYRLLNPTHEAVVRPVLRANFDVLITARFNLATEFGTLSKNISFNAKIRSNTVSSSNNKSSSSSSFQQFV
ncbi:unnamed protein product [Adineta steineri]|uniref:C2H2-type domain-containing protein n=1 Tax=Adineta steineri TaxID=433720 RepID=A0A814JZ70_9BILA|nr:unnamed protein product [Adineta steineri]